MIAFGIGIESKTCLVAVTVFFLVLFSPIDGIRDVDPTCSAAVLKMNEQLGFASLLADGARTNSNGAIPKSEVMSAWSYGRIVVPPIGNRS